MQSALWKWFPGFLENLGRLPRKSQLASSVACPSPALKSGVTSGWSTHYAGDAFHPRLALWHCLPLHLQGEGVGALKAGLTPHR